MSEWKFEYEMYILIKTKVPSKCLFSAKEKRDGFRTFETKKTHGSGERWLFAELKHSNKVEK